MEGSRKTRVATGKMYKILGLDYNTPTHIVLEETKIDKIRIEAGRRAVRYVYETRTRTKTVKVNEIIQECWREIDIKRENRMSK